MKFKPYSFKNSKQTFFSWSPVLSSDPQIVGAIGARRMGKTFGVKNRVIKDFVYKNRLFMWLRDNDDAVEAICGNNGRGFWSDISKKFPKHEFSAKGNSLYIDGKQCGVVQNFMTFYNHKGVAFDDSFFNLVLDEAIPEKGQVKRGYRARRLLNELYTVTDNRPNVRVWITSNALNRGDEILQLLGLKIKDFGIYTNRMGKHCRIAIHYADVSAKFEKMQDESVVGALIKNSRYASDMSVGLFENESELIYGTRPSNCKLIAILHGEEGAVRCWLGRDGILYVSEDDNPNGRREMRFCTDVSLADLNVSPIPDTLLTALKNALIRNGVRYQDELIKNIFLDVVMKR